MTLLPSSLSSHVPHDSSGSTAGMAGMDRETAALRWADDGRHVLKNSGAYEWWYFEAISPSGDGIVFALFEGLPFHPQYLARIHRHSHRPGATPFDRLGPELLAAYYPAAYIAVYQGGKRVAQSLNLFPPGSIVGEPQMPDIRIGPNRMTLRQDGTFGIIARGYPFDIVRAQPRPSRDQVITAKLTFAPSFPGTAHVRSFRPNGPDGAQHTWVLAAPHGRMTGNVQVIDNKEGFCRLDVRIDALGYHDHVYGQGGLGQGLNKMLWGYLQGDNWTAAWHHSVPRSGARDHADGLVIFEKGALPVVLEGPSVRLEHRQLTPWFLGHPEQLAMHGSNTQGLPIEFQVHNDTIIDTAPFHTRLAATGSLNIPGYRQYVGRGSTHVMNVRRLRWPILSDIVLMAATPVSRDDPLWCE